MANTSITVEAVFEDGVLRPMQSLPLATHQRVTLIVQVPAGRTWPEDVAAIYHDLDSANETTAYLLKEIKNRKDKGPSE